MRVIKWFILLCFTFVLSCAVYMGLTGPMDIIDQQLEIMDRDADQQLKNAGEMWQKHGR